MLETETAHATSTPALPPTLRSPSAKLVYLYLSTSDGATISELCDSLGMKKIALYGVLKTLRKRGLIVHDGGTYALA